MNPQGQSKDWVWCDGNHALLRVIKKRWRRPQLDERYGAVVKVKLNTKTGEIRLFKEQS